MNRRYRLFLMFASLCLIPPTGYAGNQASTRVVVIVDKTEPGSPLRVSGRVSFSETVVDKQVTSYRSEDVRARNISNNPVLLLVAYFDEAGPRSSGEDFDLVVDRFFQDEPILPGEDVILLRRPSGEHYISEPFRTSLDQQRPPKAEFLLRFVQFSDGSTFGDPAAATKWLNSRGSMLLALRALRQAYHEQGETAFLRALEKDTVEAQNSDWNRIRQLQRASGTQAALTLVDHLLAVALQHEAELGQK